MNIEYKKKSYLQFKSEFNFFKELEKAVTDDVVVVPQVHLERIIEMHCEPHGAYCNDYFYHGISELSFDFVLFDRSFKPLLAIELDGSSHDDAKRKKRDAFVEEICKQADLKLLRWDRKDEFDADSLRKKIKEKLK